MLDELLHCAKNTCDRVIDLEKCSDEEFDAIECQFLVMRRHDRNGKAALKP